MTNVPGCCCDQQISTGVIVAGSGGAGYGVGVNQPNLSLYLARVDDSCIPCQSGVIHGTVNIQVISIFQATSTSTTQPFEIPYGIGTQGLEYFPDTPIIEDPKNKGVWKLDPDNPNSYNEKFKLFDRLSFNTIKQLIDSIKEKTQFIYKGVPFRVCDCFTDVMYTSSTKTDDENDRAKIQKLLCSLWGVGVNALHLKWKPSLYLGEHDTTVGPIGSSSTAGVTSTTLFKAAETNYFEGWEDYWATTKHARTILLPKSLKKTNLNQPISINWMKLKRGSEKDYFTGNVIGPRDYPAPNINGNPHENSYTLKTANWRIAFSAAVWGSLYSTNYRNYPLNYCYGSVDGTDLSKRLEQINVLYNSGPIQTISIFQGITHPEPSTGNVSSAVTVAGHGCEQTTTRCDGSAGSTAILGFWGYTWANDTKFTYLYPNNTIFFGANDGDLSKSQGNKSLLYYTIKEPKTDPCYKKQELIKPGILTTTPCGVDSSGCCSSLTYQYTPGFPNGTRICVDTYANYKLAVIGFYLENNPQYINSVFLDGPEVAFGHKILSNKYYPDTPPADPCKAKPNETTYTTTDFSHIEPVTKPKFWWATNQGTQQLNNLRSTGGVIYQIRLSRPYHQGKKLTQVPYINPIAISATNNCKKYFDCIDDYTCEVTVTWATTSCCEASSWSYPYYDSKACSCSEPSKTTTNTGCAWDSDCDEVCCTTYTETIKRIAWCDAFPDDVCCIPDEIVYDECGKPIDPCGESIPKVGKKTQDTTEKVLNPFLMFNKQHQTYGNLLKQLAPNAWRVVKNDEDDSSNVDDSSYEFCKDNGIIDPDCGVTIHTFNTTEYLQSMVTTLYGKNLEYGNLKLKTVDNLPTSTSDVVMFEIRSEDWPQAITPIAFNGTAPEVKQRTGESNKTQIIERLKARTDKYPGQGNDANLYWYYRTVYELADMFAIKPIPTEADDELLKIDAKTVYYPAGIPSLEYSETKLQITSDGKIRFKTVDRYKLNWFDVPFESLLVP